MTRALVINHVSDDLLRHRALQAARKRALEAWLSDRVERTAGGP